MITHKNGFIGALLVVALGAGCAQPVEDSESGSADVVVNASALADGVTVSEGKLEFDTKAAKVLKSSGTLDKITAFANKTSTEPVFLVGGRAADALAKDGSIKADSKNPKGYLRRAVSFTQKGGTLIVATEEATLAEAADEVNKNGTVDLKAKSLQTLDEGQSILEYAKGNFHQDLSTTFGPNGDGFIPLDFSGKEVWKADLFTGGSAKIVLKQAKITIKPSLDAPIWIENFKPKEGHVILNTTVDGALEIEASADAVWNINDGGNLYNHSWGTVVAGVPLTLGVSLDWKCDLGATANGVASIGGTATGTLRAGASYEGTKLTPVLDRPTYKLERLGPTLDARFDASGRCDLIAFMTVQLFDVVGPNATVKLYSTLDTHGTAKNAGAQATATLKVGVDASVGGSLRPFGIKIADINVDPYNYEKTLFDGAFQIGKP